MGSGLTEKTLGQGIAQDLPAASITQAADMELALALVAQQHGALGEGAAGEVGAAAQGTPAPHLLQPRQHLLAPAPTRKHTFHVMCNTD